MTEMHSDDIDDFATALLEGLKERMRSVWKPSEKPFLSRHRLVSTQVETVESRPVIILEFVGLDGSDHVRAVIDVEDAYNDVSQTPALRNPERTVVEDAVQFYGIMVWEELETRGAGDPEEIRI